MTKEDVQELIELTPEQEKAFNSLKRAYAKCVKEGIYFHQILDYLSPFNGNNIDTINDTGDDNGIYNIQWLNYPTLHTVCGWADDNHFVHFK